MEEVAGVTRYTALGMRQLRAKEKNNLAMVILNPSLKGETLSIYIIVAESTQWLDGLAHLIRTALETWYNPRSSMKSIILINDLATIVCTKRAIQPSWSTRLLGSRPVMPGWGSRSTTMT
jgi:hypothetical protein